MLKFSGFMFIESTAVALFQHLDKLIVGLTLGPALAGVYAVGTSVSLRMSMVVGPITEVLIPYASLKDSLREHEQLQVIFRKVSRYVSLIVAGIGGLAIIWMEEFLSIWISPAYAAQYSTVFQLLICAYSLAKFKSNWSPITDRHWQSAVYFAGIRGDHRSNAVLALFSVEQVRFNRCSAGQFCNGCVVGLQLGHVSSVRLQ